MSQLQEKLEETEIPKGGFLVLAGSESGYGFSAEIFGTVEEARMMKDFWTSLAPYTLAISSLVRDKDYSSNDLLDPHKCLKILQMSITIYNDQKQLVC